MAALGRMEPPLRMSASGRLLPPAEGCNWPITVLQESAPMEFAEMMQDFSEAGVSIKQLRSKSDKGIATTDDDQHRRDPIRD